MSITEARPKHLSRKRREIVLNCDALQSFVSIVGKKDVAVIAPSVRLWLCSFHTFSLKEHH